MDPEESLAIARGDGCFYAFSKWFGFRLNLAFLLPQTQIRVLLTQAEKDEDEASEAGSTDLQVCPAKYCTGCVTAAGAWSF